VGSRLAGRKVRTKLQNLVSCSTCRIDVDFSNISLISSSFADEVFGKLFLQLGAIDFGQRITLSRVQSTVKLLVDKAISQRVAFGKFD
ncbi:MAG: STAS-like domain-containing protein, partial [Stellaceae bacterium]